MLVKIKTKEELLEEFGQNPGYKEFHVTFPSDYYVDQKFYDLVHTNGVNHIIDVDPVEQDEDGDDYYDCNFISGDWCLGSEAIHHDIKPNIYQEKRKTLWVEQ